MTEYVGHNLAVYSFKREFATATTSKLEICVCCMAENTNFINLVTCKHTAFLSNFDQIQYGPPLLVCHLCHSIIKKISNFKHQVEESLKVFGEASKPAKKVINLKVSKLDVFSSLDSIYESDFEGVKSESTNQSPATTNQRSSSTNQDTEFEAATEIKVERDSSDFETDLPLSEVKKEIKKGNRKAAKGKTKKKKVQKSDEAYPGKIKIITLTLEELMLERESERVRESFLSLPYRCDDCVVGFDHEITLEEHRKQRHTEKNNSFTCGICKSVLSTENSYKEHCKRHLRRYSCMECGKRNNTLQAVVQHYNTAHTDREAIHTVFTCHQCGFTTDSNRKYRYHRDKHREKPTCSICGNTFVNATGLKIHMFTIHKQSGRQYGCAECRKTYAAKSGLAAHRARAHQPDHNHPPHYCQPCDKLFRCIASLRHHLQTHSKHRSEASKKFPCSECSLRFVSAPALAEHVRWEHRGDTSHRCQQCHKVFKNARYLQRHVDFVHEKKRLPRNKICDYCGRGFTTLCILRAHIRTHTGERPLRCARCPAAFAHSAALYTHNKLHADRA